MSLFPSAKAISEKDNVSTQQNKDLGWLSNKSYTADTAKKLVVFQQELNKELRKYDSTHESSGIEKSEVIDLTLDDGKSWHKEKIEQSSFDNASLTNDGTSKEKTGKHQRQFSPESETDSKVKRKKKKKTGDNSSNNNESSDENTSHKSSHSKKRKKKSHCYSGSEDRSHKDKDDSSDEYQRRKKSKKKKKKNKHGEKLEDYASGKQFNSAFKNKVFLDEVNIPMKDAFHIDRSADLGNLGYGSLYSGKVAHYTPLVRQSLGGNYNQRQGYKKQVENKNTARNESKKKARNERYFGKDNRSLLKQVAEPVLVSKSEKDNVLQSGSNSDALFLELELKKEDTNLRKTDIRDQMLDQATSLYIQGKGKQLEDAEEDIVKTQNPVRLKIGDFNRRLREDPHNVSLWLEFVKFQDSSDINEENTNTAKNNSTESTRLTSQRCLMDKKLSILEKALAANPGNIQLLLAKLEINSEVLETSQINKEMEQLLFVHSANITLWRQYLTYNQSILSAFTVSKVSKLYHKCFKMLTNILDGKMQTHSVPEHLDKALLDLLLQYCFMLKRTSHKERLLATIQAMLEYNLFCPPSMKSVAKETKMAAFEDFWESNCPRVGTAGAVGWNCWQENPQAACSQDIVPTKQEVLEELEEDVIEAKGSKLRTWLTLESLREVHHWFPWQPDRSAGQTEDDCEDVERLILYDDLAPAVFDIPVNFHLPLVCGIVYILLGNKVECKSVTDMAAVLSTERLDQVIRIKGNQHLKEELSSGVIPPELVNFVVNLLKMSLPHFTSDKKVELTLMLLQTQLLKYVEQTEISKKEKKEMRSIVKNVLKEEENRNNLSLWMFYINLETQIGKAGEALSIIETALMVHSGVTVEGMSRTVIDLIHLFSLYAEIALNIKNQLTLSSRELPVPADVKKRVAYALSCLLNGEKVNFQSVKEISGSAILRVLSKFSKEVDIVLHQFEVKGIDKILVSQKLEHLIWCYCLFQYCATDFSATQNVFSKCLAACQTKIISSDLESIEQKLLTHKLQLILHHMTTSAVSLQVLRECLDLALEKYPNNPEFLGLFVDMEKKSRITGRLNRYFDKWCHWSESHVPVVFAVYTQMEFLVNLQAMMESGEDGIDVTPSGVVHRTRSWLEASLSRPQLRHCPLLWRMYLQLERKASSNSRLKGVFYRAIQECPSVKSLYVFGAEILGEDHLQEIIDLMTEKELRVQLPLEELDILMG